MTADTRKDKRASVQLKVRFKSATVDEFIEQYAVDISRGGIFIKSKQPMAIGTLLKFEFQLKDESRLIHGVGRVVWKRDEADAAGPDKPAGMGVKFIKMDPESKALVDRIVDARGDAAGAYEAGGGDSGDASAPSVAPPRQKSTMAFDAAALAPPKESGGAFFPSTSSEADMPPPEDRTQVRHASEFLASALGAAGEDVEAAAEAEKRAAEARKRSEEIEKQRAREAAARHDREEADRQEAERRAEAESAKAAARVEAEAERKAAADAAKKASSVPGASAKFADEPRKVPPTELVPAKPRTSDRPQAAKVPSVPPMAPPPEPRSNTALIAVIVVVVLAGLGFGGWKMGLFGGAEGGSGTGGEAGSGGVGAAPDAGSATAENETDAGTAEGDGGVTTAENAADAGTEVAVAADAGAQVAAAPTTADVRIESTPPGATILVGGQEKGTTPASVALPLRATTTVTLRLAGFTATTRDVVVGAAAPSTVRVTMQSFPYAIACDTTPSGARCSANGHAVVAPGTIVLGARPRGAVTVTASRPGYDQGHAVVLLPEYAEADGQMIRHVSITLEQHVGGAAHPAGGGDSDAGAAHPAGGGDHPAGGGDHPAGGGDHPAGGGDHPAGGGDHPAGGGDHPAGGGGGEPIPDNPFG